MMKSIILAAAACVTLSSAAYGVDDTTRNEIAGLNLMKANAYAKAVDLYCFADRPFASQPLADAAAQEAEFRAELGQDEKATDIIADADRAAAEHLKVDQSACAPAESFVDKIASTVEIAKQRLGDIKQKLGSAKAAEAKAAQAEERAKSCHELQTRTDTADLEALISARLPLLDCADILGVDNIAKVDARIETLRAEKSKQTADATAASDGKAAADAKRAADVAANIAKPADKPITKPAPELAFVGKWDHPDGDCQGRLWDLNSKTYDGTPVSTIQRNGDDYRVVLQDGYIFMLENVTKRTLTWHSLESGDRVYLKRCK